MFWLYAQKSRSRIAPDVGPVRPSYSSFGVSCLPCEAPNVLKSLHPVSGAYTACGPCQGGFGPSLIGQHAHHVVGRNFRQLGSVETVHLVWSPTRRTRNAEIALWNGRCMASVSGVQMVARVLLFLESFGSVRAGYCWHAWTVQ